MNPSTVVPSSQGNPNATLSSNNVANSANVLVQLEQKYGMKKLRLDSAQTSPPRSRRRQAHKFEQYTAWLMHHLNNPSSELSQVEFSDNQHLDQHLESDRVDLGIEIVNRSTAEFDTHFTICHHRWDPQTETICTPEPAEPFSPKTISTDLAIPVDNSNLSLHRLIRIDNAHSTQSVIQPVRRDRNKTPGIVLEMEPIVYNGLNLTAEKANPIDPVSRTRTSSSNAAWEVHDFNWPPIIDQIGFLDTQAASSLCETAMQVLDTSRHRLAIVGCGRGPGTTTISMFLAKTLASRNKSVLLVDADMSKPDLTRRLGIVSEISWLNAIKGNPHFHETIIRSFKCGISVMPVQKLTAPAILPRFVYDNLGVIVEEVRQAFDFVLIDMGPSSQFVRELSRPNLLVDAAVLVHNTRIPDHSLFARNQNELTSFGIKRLVVAENFSPKAA